MINVTNAYRKALYENKRNWLPYVDITLADGTVLPQFTKDTIWASGLSVERAVSDDNKFTALGSAMMGTATVIIDNLGEKWNDYDFLDADVNIRIGLPVNGAPEVIKMGRYTVENATYNGATVTLTLNDYMHQFDRPYVTNLSYPATLYQIASNACTQCGVQLQGSSFPHSNYTAQTKPSSDNATFRDVIAWIAQIAGCYAYFNVDGKLAFGWFTDAILDAAQEGTDGGEFDDGTPKYTTGDALEGGSFNPWNLGDEEDGGVFQDSINYHSISRLFSETINLDDTVITGVRVTREYEDANNERQTASYTSGTEDYLISIEGNELITYTDVQTIATYLGTQVNGLRFRKCNVTHQGDPTIEAGDVALLYDHKNREYPILITRTKFTAYGRQTTVCGSETPARNRATRYTQETKNYVDLRRQLKQQQDRWDLAEASLRTALANSSGLFETNVEDPVGSGSYKRYYHDKSTLAASNIVMLFTDYGFTLTSDYQNGQNATWYGIGADGHGILDVLDTHGVSADWILADGTISDSSNKNVWDLVNSTFSMNDGSINLGRIGNTNDYNFTVNSSGQVGIKNGSIELGDKVNTNYYFAVDTDGKFEWKSLYTQLTNDGQLTMTKGSINLGNGKFILNDQGEMTSVDGYYKTILDNGFLRWWYNNSYIGKMGASIFTISGTDYYGAMHDIGYNARFGGFAVQYRSTSANATMKFYYDRTDDVFHSDLELRANYGLKTYLLKGNPGLRVEANQFGVEYNNTTYLLLANGNLSVPQGAVHAGTSVYANGEKVVTPSDLNIYADGTIKWKAYDT